MAVLKIKRNENAFLLPQTVSVPMELYKSLQGKYFIGYADNLFLNNGTSAWARLYNPVDSGVNLFVNVWTVTEVSSAPFRAQFWFNATPPGTPQEIAVPTPTNTTILPPPRSHIILQQASDVSGEPTDGVKAFVRRGEPDTTVVETEKGKLIFPPGGSFLVFLTLIEPITEEASARFAFGWWEEKIEDKCRK